MTPVCAPDRSGCPPSPDRDTGHRRRGPARAEPALTGSARGTASRCSDRKPPDADQHQRGQTPSRRRPADPDARNSNGTAVRRPSGDRDRITSTADFRKSAKCRPTEREADPTSHRRPRSEALPRENEPRRDPGLSRDRREGHDTKRADVARRWNANDEVSRRWRPASCDGRQQRRSTTASCDEMTTPNDVDVSRRESMSDDVIIERPRNRDRRQTDNRCSEAESTRRQRLLCDVERRTRADRSSADETH